MVCVFWSVLAGFYLALSIVTIIVSIPIFRRFKEIVEAEVGFSLHTENGQSIWMDSLYG